MMQAGVSTSCCYPELTEQALVRIAEMGVKGTEIFFNAPSEFEEPFLHELAHIASGNGMKILSIHPFTSGLEPLLFFSEYRRRFLDGIELYRRFFHAANLLGANLLVFHGDRRGSSCPRSRYFDAFGELMEVGRSMGVIVAQENVPRCAGWCPDFFADMARALPNACFVLDVKQCIRGGCTPFEMLEAMGSGMVHMHVSDHNPQCDCLPIGEGELDLGALLRRAAELGFDGGVVLELYRNSYRDDSALSNSYHRMKMAIGQVNAGKKPEH